MAQTIWTQTGSGLTSAREREIFSNVFSDGILEGMAPYVSGSDTVWTLSLSSGKYIAASVVIEEDANQTSLWTSLDSYGAGGTNSGGGSQFLFYAEYSPGSVGPNYRFLYGTYSDSITLSDRGDASHDPNHADTDHISAPAVELARMYVDDAASAITDTDYVRIYRSDLLRTLEERQAQGTREILLAPFTAKFSIDSSENLLEWDELTIRGINTRVPTSSSETHRIIDINVTASASSGSYTYELVFDRSDATDGGILFVRPDWDNPTTAVELLYASVSSEFLTDHSDKSQDLMGSANGYASDDVYPYRPQFEDIIVLGYVLGDDPTTIVWRNGQVHQLKNSADASVSTFGTSSNYVQTVSSTSYPSSGTVYPDDSGNIDLDDIITNLPDLSDLTLDDVYDSTATGAAAGDGRSITVDGGAVELTNDYGEGSSPFNDTMASAMRVNIGDVVTLDSDEDFERGIDIKSETVPQSDRSGSGHSWSERIALSFRYPIYFDDGSNVIDHPQPVTISRSGTPPSEEVLITDSSVSASVWEQAMWPNSEVYVTFALTDGTQDANNKAYILYRDGSQLKLKQTDGTTTGFSTDFDSGGSLAVPINNQDMTAWVTAVYLSKESKFFDVNIMQTLNVQGNIYVGEGTDPDMAPTEGRIYYSTSTTAEGSINLKDGVSITGGTGSNGATFTSAGTTTITSSGTKLVLSTTGTAQDIELDAANNILFVSNDVKIADNLNMFTDSSTGGNLVFTANDDGNVGSPTGGEFEINADQTVDINTKNYDLDASGVVDIYGAGGVTITGNTDLTGTFSVSSSLTVTGNLNTADILSNGTLSIDNIGEYTSGAGVTFNNDVSFGSNDVTDITYLTALELRSYQHKSNVWYPYTGTDVYINTSSGVTTIGGTLKTDQIEQATSSGTLIVGESGGTLDLRGSINQLSLYLEVEIYWNSGSSSYNIRYEHGPGSVDSITTAGTGIVTVNLADTLSNYGKIFMQVEDDASLSSTQIWHYYPTWLSTDAVKVYMEKVTLGASASKAAHDMTFWLRIYEN